MKRIEELSVEPDGLRKYRTQLQQEYGTPDWHSFRSNDRTALTELQEALVKVQRGLCAYCEINIHDAAPVQVEHYLPKSKGEGTEKKSDRVRHLDYRNLLACCMGGVSSTHDRPSNYESFQDHYLPDHALSQSCGAAKGDREPGDQVLNPRLLRITDKIVKIYPDGTIHPDKAGCLAAEIPEERVQSTIEILRLDCLRLTFARRKFWAAHRRTLPPERMKSIPNNPYQLKLLLGPNEYGWLRRFWITTRCYLQPVGVEEWIKAQSHLKTIA